MDYATEYLQPIPLLHGRCSRGLCYGLPAAYTSSSRKVFQWIMLRITCSLPILNRRCSSGLCLGLPAACLSLTEGVTVDYAKDYLQPVPLKVFQWIMLRITTSLSFTKGLQLLLSCKCGSGVTKFVTNYLMNSFWS